MEWIGYSTVDDFLSKEGIDSLCFDPDGVFLGGDKSTHLDIFSMKGSEIDWESSPECKIEQVKDVFAVLFGDSWIEKFEELMEVS